MKGRINRLDTTVGDTIRDLKWFEESVRVEICNVLGKVATVAAAEQQTVEADLQTQSEYKSI